MSEEKAVYDTGRYPKVNEALIVSVDFTQGEDTGVLIVGRKRMKQDMEIINAFQGEEALALYTKLITKKNAQ